jgi:hypothetical protein
LKADYRSTRFRCEGDAVDLYMSWLVLVGVCGHDVTQQCVDMPEQHSVPIFNWCNASKVDLREAEKSPRICAPREVILQGPRVSSGQLLTFGQGYQYPRPLVSNIKAFDGGILLARDAELLMANNSLVMK